MVANDPGHTCVCADALLLKNLFLKAKKIYSAESTEVGEGLVVERRRRGEGRRREREVKRNATP